MAVPTFEEVRGWTSEERAQMARVLDELLDRPIQDGRTTFTADRSTGSVPSFSPAGLSTTTPQSFIVAPDAHHRRRGRPSRL